MTVTVVSVTLWVHHTQLKEATKDRDRWVTARSYDFAKDKIDTVSMTIIGLFCPLCFTMGKAHDLHIMLGLELIKQ